jgi:N-acetylneuraminic acid mutarotase
LLPNGKVQVVAGLGSSGATASTELYDPATATWTVGSLTVARYSQSATLLPSGDLLVAGGFNTAGLTNSEFGYSSSGTWTINSQMNGSRYLHTATLLPNGKVLVAGGWNAGFLASAELYNPMNATWTFTGPMNTTRLQHTATLLPNGKVLVAGGWNGTVLSNAELFDLASGTWTVTGSLNTGRFGHTATLLANGKLLVAGGYGSPYSGILYSAELYDPASGTWSATGSMNTNRVFHTATLLPNGKVLVAGGNGSNGPAGAELFDPASGTWANTGPMNNVRYNHTATLLPNGKVLVVGGLDNAQVAGYMFEFYDPASNLWTNPGIVPWFDDIAYQTATLLPSGKVLLAGGDSGVNGAVPYITSELYDPVRGMWDYNLTNNLSRDYHTATLLPNGQVLVAGGYNGRTLVEYTNGVVYDSGLGYSNSWQPQITSVTSPLTLGSSLAVAGTQFRGISEASGGNNDQDSASDYPLLQLYSLANEQKMFLIATNWSTNSFVSTPVTNFPPGYALVTAFVNGIPSSSSILFINPALANIVLLHPARLGNGAFQTTFTNLPTFSFSVLVSTNLALPGTNWTLLGGSTETSPGQYQVTDPQATNYPNLFYRVRWP